MQARDDDTEATEAVDVKLQDWRQGDCITEPQGFVHRFSAAIPASDEAKQLAKDDPSLDLVEASVRGFVVLTQTCDIVRSVRERPYIQVAPLIEVTAQDLVDVRSWRRPRYVYIPSLTQERLVADLDRVMTLEKPILVNWARTRGCTTEEEARSFAQALSRKVSRFAFPDDFTSLVGGLTTRLSEKHGRDSAEGRALRALDEIRVQAAPDWEAATVDLMFWFIRSPSKAAFEGAEWHQHLGKWLPLVVPTGRYRETNGSVVTLADMSADDYVHSDRLDLDRLSRASAR